MLVNENLVQDIVQEVVAKMQIAESAGGKHGIFTDMNEAVAAAKASQAIVRRMSIDQREQIISNIRRKTRENAEIIDIKAPVGGGQNPRHRRLKDNSVVWRQRTDFD